MATPETPPLATQAPDDGPGRPAGNGAAGSPAGAAPGAGVLADPDADLSSSAGTAAGGTAGPAAQPAADWRNGAGTPTSWSALLEREVSARLAAQSSTQAGEAHSELMEELAREFEGTIIRTALRHTRGRRIDAALRLGIGRNTITRKIQELRLDEEDER